MANVFWTDERKETLKKLVAADVKYHVIAKAMDTGEGAVKAAVKRYILGRPDETPESVKARAQARTEKQRAARLTPAGKDA